MKRTVKRAIVLILALVLALGLVPGIVFADGGPIPDTPSRPGPGMFQVTEKEVYEQKQQWSDLFGRYVNVHGDYLGMALNIKYIGTNPDFLQYAVVISKTKKTPARLGNVNADGSSPNSEYGFTSGIIEPNTVYYVYIATGNAMGYGGDKYSAYQPYTNYAWSEWSEPITIKTKPSTRPNPITVKNKNLTYKASTLKKAAKKLDAKKIFSVKKSKGKLQYKIYKQLSKNAKKYIKVSKAGKITIAKGAKKGKYRLSIEITDTGNKIYAKAIRHVILNVTVK